MCPRARQFTQPQITAAALELLQLEGWSALTARAIAKHLGTSTTPIYSVFASMEEIEAAVRVEAIDRQLHSMLTPRSGNPLLDLALGYVAFARDEPALFRFLFIDRPAAVSMAERQRLEGRGFSDRLTEIFATESGVDPLDTYFGEQPVSARDDMAYRGWIFAHGLAMLVCSGSLPGADDAELQRLLEGAGFAFYLLQQDGSFPGRPVPVPEPEPPT